MTVPAILDHRGEPFRAFDSVTTAIEAAGSAVNPLGRQQGIMSRLFAPQLAYAAYLASGLMQKVIDIPAQDRVREWREWQADSEEVTKLEAEEKRLRLLQKLRQAEVLRGIGGGAMILALPGDPSQPVNPRTIRPGTLAAVNLISRWQLTLVDIDQNIASPTYGEPAMFRVTSGGTTVNIHPSRVIPFRGDPIPAGYNTSSDEAYWGQSRLVKVWREVERSDETQGWFAALVRKAKLLRIGIPGLTDLTATDQGHQRLNRRIAAIALSESVLNATVYDAAVGTGVDKSGEKIDDYQVTWAGIPAMMDAFDQRVAAVADIPFTRLMGRSPAGMNATGEHDTANWAAAVAAGQELELRPCLERLDPFLFASAGVDPTDIWWKFAPLYKPTPKEEADRFKVLADAIAVIADTNIMPSAALNAGAQSVIEANGFLPGATPILAGMDEAERFGLSPDDDGTDPSALTEGGDPDLAGGGSDDGSEPPARRAANDSSLIVDQRKRQGHSEGRHGSYDPSQPRNGNGRWRETGAEAKVKGDTNAARVDRLTDDAHETLKAAGVKSIGIDRSINRDGQSSTYVTGKIVAHSPDGREFSASVGVRVSDHAVSSNRVERDRDRIQYYVEHTGGKADMDRISADIGRRQRELQEYANTAPKREDRFAAKNAARAAQGSQEAKAAARATAREVHFRKNGIDLSSMTKTQANKLVSEYNRANPLS